LDKTIVTALLVIAGVISAVFVFNSIYPAIVQSSDAMISMERRMDERLKSDIQIIHASKSITTTTLVWVKNVGSLRLAPVETCDIFFGPEGNFVRIPYGTGAGEWQYTLENAAEWTPSATVRITINTNPESGKRYFIKLVLVNGVSDESYFSVR